MAKYFLRFQRPSARAFGGRPRLRRPLVRPAIEMLEPRRMLASPDGYEPDDTPALARDISIDGTSQQHSIHDTGYDIDWVRFTLAVDSDLLVQTTEVDVSLYRAADTDNSIAEGDSYTGILRSYALPAGTYLLQMQTFGWELDAYTVSVTASTPVQPLDRIDYVRLAGEGFNSVQFTPDGRLAQLLWYNDALTYRVRTAEGKFTEESVTTLPSPGPGSFDPRDAAGTQLLFAADATPHVLMSVDGSSLEHYRRDDGGWSLVENIPLGLANSESVVHLAAAVGAQDTLHFVVTVGDFAVGRLLYGSNKSGNWQTSEVTNPAAIETTLPAISASYFRYVSLAIDANNAAHVAYTPEFLDNGQGDFAVPFSRLAYATNRTGVWTTQIIHQPSDDSGDSGCGASIAIAPDGQPAIAQFFVDRGSNGFASLARLQYHKRQSNGTWATETVASSADGYAAGDGNKFTGYSPQLLFGPDGSPHIAFSDYASQRVTVNGGEYADEYAGQIRHAVKTGSTWQIGRIVAQTDPRHNQMIYPTMAIGSSEIVFVGVRRFDYLDSDNALIRSEHFYASAALPQTGLTVSTELLTIAEKKQTTLTVKRHNGNNTVPLTIRLTNGDSSELSMATEVTIPAGQLSVTTTVTAVNDNVVDGTQTVPITASATGYVTGRTIVNVTDELYFQIHGAKFEDVNADGRRDATEPGLAGWMIFVDLNQNGVLDAGEPTATTDASGAYSFEQLRAGTYTLAEVPQAGWGRTAPLSGSYQVTRSGGQTANGIDFGGLPGGFDATTGRLILLVLGDDQLQIVTNSGEVVINRNGQPDSAPAGVPAASVTSIVILGGEGNNRFDLQSVTHVEFAALQSIVLREPGQGVDLVEGSTVDDQFFTGGPDTLRGHDGDDSFSVRDLQWTAIEGGPGQDTLRLDGANLHLDLSALQANRLSNIEVIDIAGTGPNQLTLSAPQVIDLSSDSDTLFVESNADDQVHFVSAWKFVAPTFIGDRFFNRVAREGATAYLHGPHPWQNPANPLDTSRDGSVMPFDALLVINALNGGQTGSLPNPETSGQLPPYSYDTSGDDALLPIDALLVINHLNGIGEPKGEGEAGDVAARTTATTGKWIGVANAATSESNAADATSQVRSSPKTVLGSGQRTNFLQSLDLLFAKLDKPQSAAICESVISLKDRPAGDLEELLDSLLGRETDEK